VYLVRRWPKRRYAAHICTQERSSQIIHCEWSSNIINFGLPVTLYNLILIEYVIHGGMWTITKGSKAFIVQLVTSALFLPREPKALWQSLQPLSIVIGQANLKYFQFVRRCQLPL